MQGEEALAQGSGSLLTQPWWALRGLTCLDSCHTPYPLLTPVGGLWTPEVLADQHLAEAAADWLRTGLATLLATLQSFCICPSRPLPSLPSGRSVETAESLKILKDPSPGEA